MPNNVREDEVMFEITKHIAVLNRYQTGWSKEVNIVSWNGGTPKYDIRDWSADHDRMSRGITLHPEEMRCLVEALKDKDLSINTPQAADRDAGLER